MAQAQPLMTIAETAPSGVMVDLVIILTTAAVVSLVLTRLRLATIPAYLIAGALIGPHALKLVSDSGSIDTISHIAVILLMFGLGMHTDPAELRGRLVSTLVVGVVSSTITAACVTGVLVMVGLHWALALLIGMALAMSSTAAVLRLFQQRRELEQAHGRLSFGVLIVQDLLVVGALALLPVLAGRITGAQSEGTVEIDLAAMMFKGLKSIGAIGLLILLGRIVLPRLLELAAGSGDGEVPLVISAAAALGAAGLTSHLGFSAELGAFIAGLLLSATPLRFQISGQLAPMRDLFMAVFFVAVGLNVDVMGALGGWWIVLLGTVGLVLLKAIVIGGTSWAVGASAPVATLTGLALAQGGEFTLVIIAAGRNLGVDFEPAGPLVAIVVLSLVITPWLIQLGHVLAGRVAHVATAPWIRTRVSDDSHGQAQSAHVIIAGFGPIGRAVAAHLETSGRPYTVIEMNPSTVKKQAALGRTVIYGDASNPDVLRSAGVERAHAAILTIPDDGAMLRSVRAIRAMAPQAFIAARANYMSKAMQAKQMGANYAVAEELATAEAMSQQVAAALGIDLAGAPRS